MTRKKPATPAARSTRRRPRRPAAQPKSTDVPNIDTSAPGAVPAASVQSTVEAPSPAERPASKYSYNDTAAPAPGTVGAFQYGARLREWECHRRHPNDPSPLTHVFDIYESVEVRGRYPRIATVIVEPEFSKHAACEIVSLMAFAPQLWRVLRDEVRIQLVLEGGQERFGEVARLLHHAGDSVPFDVAPDHPDDCVSDANADKAVRAIAARQATPPAAPARVPARQRRRRK